jgi:MtrB/PioB family decaheme-associated outer membrane protein
MSTQPYFKLSPLSVAMLAALASFPALADDVADLISPNQADVSINTTKASGVDGLYRQYTGVNKSGTFGGLGVKYIDRDDTGRWLRLEAINLGARNQEFKVSAEKQADWILGASYDEMTRYSYLDIQSNNVGLGSTSVVPGAGAFGDVPTLNTKRESFSLLGTKHLGPETSFTATVKSEEKTGLRLAGYNGYVFAPEPISQKHTQFSASIEHASKAYQLSAGYYASIFKNDHQALQYNNSALATTVSLPSDNFFYSLHLDAAYNFTDDTRGTLRASYSKATQDEATKFFPALAITPAGTTLPNGTVGSLRGRVDNIELFGSLSSRLTKETKLLATWKFEKKDDKTPYLWFSATDQDMRTRPESFFSNKGKLEITHNFRSGTSLTGGYDYSQKRNKGTQYYEIYTRDEIVEHTARMAARTRLSESVTGSLTLAHADRSGSQWVTPLAVSAVTGGPVYPVQRADRVREKVRAQASWMASEALDINGSIEGYVDDFKANRWGIRKGNGTLLSLDANYRVSDNWGLNTWYSNNVSRYDSSSFGDISNGTAIVTNRAWDAKIKYESHQLGLGVKGRVNQFDVGVNYTYVHDFGNERISSEFGAGDMPRTKYYQNTLKMFGEYLAGKNTKVRLEYLVTKYAMDDYSWQAASAYNSNTSAYLKPNQTTQIIGLTLTQSF